MYTARNGTELMQVMDFTLMQVCYQVQGRNLRGGGYGGMTHPPPPTPDLAGHRGSLQGKNVVSVSITDCVSFDVGENVDVGRKFFRVYYVRF